MRPTTYDPPWLRQMAKFPARPTTYDLRPTLRRLPSTLLLAVLGGVLVAIGAVGTFYHWSVIGSHATEPIAQQAESAAEEAQLAEARQRMVDRQLRGRGIADPAVLAAMGRVPRHRFVAGQWRDAAYTDQPLPIGQGQTISQPYIVALMTQLARPSPNCRALDVGTGSGYQAAVLAELCKEVYSIEILRPLADEAASRLAALGYENISVRQGDGYQGWPEHAPFDLILVTAATERVPQPLVDQLAPGGRLVIPIGGPHREQHLMLLQKQADGSLRRRVVAPAGFVPMTGGGSRW